MKFAALVSGGKDSNYNILHCLKNGHKLIAFGNLYPEHEEEQELDSFMFQTVGHDLISWYPKCTGIPLYRNTIKRNGSKNIDLNYSKTANDEIEDLYELLYKIKTNIPELEAVSVGAILSSYQRTRVEDVCARLGLVVLSYLWQRDQQELMQEMCLMSKKVTGLISYDEESEAGKLDARIIKVAAIGLNEGQLGKSLPELFPTMLKLNSMYEVHICGEGGEFETMVLDAPFFKFGHLRLNSVQDVSDGSNDGVFNASFDISFIPQKLADYHLGNELARLPIPPLLNDKWLELHSLLSEYNFLRTDNIFLNKKTIQSAPVAVNETGNLLYISNIRPGSGTNLKQQCENVFSQLESILVSRSIFRSQIVSSSLILSDMSNFSEVNTCYNEYFSVSAIGPLPPARTCIGSTFLNSRLQISVVVDLSARCTPTENHIVMNAFKDGLHVQGRSYWCPCNIGPYSQAIWNKNDRNKVAYISGQIALNPSTMEMWNGSTPLSKEVSQSVLSLRHYSTLAATINAHTHVSLTCFVSKSLMVPIVAKTWYLYTVEMAETSDLWIHQENVDRNCLIIVETSELPKNALCEWSGINCEHQIIEDDYDEDDLAAQIHKNLTLKNQLQFQNPIGANDFIISENDVRRHFITLFLDTSESLIKALSEYKETQITLYYTPDDTIPEYTHVEYIPVLKVYDHSGSPKKYGLLIKY